MRFIGPMKPLDNHMCKCCQELMRWKFKKNGTPYCPSAQRQIKYCDSLDCTKKWRSRAGHIAHKTIKKKCYFIMPRDSVIDQWLSMSLVG